jgi:RNA-directed DNA polymerase
MAQLGLTINEAKTSVKDARVERFDFLGYTFGPHWGGRGGRQCLGASPSKKSIGRAKDKVSDILVAGNPGTWDEVRDRLNAVLRGWSGCFAYGWRLKACKTVDRHVTERVRGFLTRRHKVRERGYKEFPDQRIHGDLGVMRLIRKGNTAQPWALP